MKDYTEIIIMPDNWRWTNKRISETNEYLETRDPEVIAHFPIKARIAIIDYADSLN